MKWQSRGDWEQIKGEPTPLSRSLRPATPEYVKRVHPLAVRGALELAVRRSIVAWKEFSAARGPPIPDLPGAQGNVRGT